MALVLLLSLLQGCREPHTSARAWPGHWREPQTSSCRGCTGALGPEVTPVLARRRGSLRLWTVAAVRPRLRHLLSHLSVRLCRCWTSYPSSEALSQLGSVCGRIVVVGHHFKTSRSFNPKPFVGKNRDSPSSARCLARHLARRRSWR